MFNVFTSFVRRREGANGTCLQNIDFQTTILSRFDMIFIVKDEHNEQRDRVSVRCLVH